MFHKNSSKQQQKNSKMIPRIHADDLKMSNSLIKPIAFVRLLWAPVFETNNTDQEALLYLCMGTPLYGYESDEKWISIEIEGKERCWVLKNHVNFAKKKIKRSMHNKIRDAIIKSAMLFLEPENQPSNHFKIDSTFNSAQLIHMIYQAQNMQIPQTASELHQTRAPIQGTHCKPADLLFLIDAEDKKKIFPFLYLGDNHLFYFSEKDKKCRIIDGSKELNIDISLIKNGQSIGKYLIFLGTFFS